MNSRHATAAVRLLSAILAAVTLWAQGSPNRVPPRRSTQLADGFGMNVDLPRDPHLPWTRRWWTRLFDSGVKWVRIGQYENSSERTSWDWVERTAGHYDISPEVDEAIRSLHDNGIEIEIEVQYSNPLYQRSSEERPKRVLPPPVGIGPGDRPPHPIFIPPTTEEQRAAFLRYARFMVSRYKGLVGGWELWNEPDIDYWQPHADTKEQLAAKAHEYGRLLCGFADVVHETDPRAKVISAGTATPDVLFARNALTACAAKIDVVAYHTYPGFGSNHSPEEADTLEHAALFREQVMHIPATRNNLEFWDNEWNVSPLWKNSNESVQARYVPRFYLYNLAQHVRGAMWVFVPSTEGNEDNLYGILNGDTGDRNGFAPRQAYRSFAVTSALFGETETDPLTEFHFQQVPASLEHGQVQSYAFRNRVSGKRIYAFWLAIPAEPVDNFTPVMAELAVRDPDLKRPILIDVLTGAVQNLAWKNRVKATLPVPLKESVMAVADASYLNWKELPETPSELIVTPDGRIVQLRWRIYDEPRSVEIFRSRDFGPWQKLAQVDAPVTRFTDGAVPFGRVSYRVRVVSTNGPSAWSNPAWVTSKLNETKR